MTSLSWEFLGKWAPLNMENSSEIKITSKNLISEKKIFVVMGEKFLHAAVKKFENMFRNYFEWFCSRSIKFGNFSCWFFKYNVRIISIFYRNTAKTINCQYQNIIQNVQVKRVFLQEKVKLSYPRYKKCLKKYSTIIFLYNNISSKSLRFIIHNIHYTCFVTLLNKKKRKN